MPDEWIRQWGDPTLHEAAAPVQRLDGVLRAQIGRMRAKLIEADGAGLAATQIGLMRRVFVYRASREDDVEVLINPGVLAASEERATFIEGCLSFQSVVVAVERPVAVRIAGMDLDGRLRSRDAEGLEASLLQHELDHLDGILTLDRAEPAERRRAVATLRAPHRDGAGLAAA